MKRAASKIIAGLEDAVAYARGDKTRGKVSFYSDRGFVTPKEHPVLFSGPMVRALLSGRKTQTRRIVTPHNSYFWSAPREYWKHSLFSEAYADRGYLHAPSHSSYDDDHSEREECPRCLEMGWDATTHRLYSKFAIGDTLWVRETWAHDAPDLDSCRRGCESDGIRCGPYYKADASQFDADSLRWRPSVHMPRWASRISLEITAVRAERLQDINEEDCEAEGIGDGYLVRMRVPPPRKYSFKALWEGLNGEDSWAKNPWVWVLNFERVEQATSGEAA